jgi:hypothetical protein
VAVGVGVLGHDLADALEDLDIALSANVVNALPSLRSSPWFPPIAADDHPRRERGVGLDGP